MVSSAPDYSGQFPVFIKHSNRRAYFRRRLELHANAVGAYIFQIPDSPLLYSGGIAPDELYKFGAQKASFRPAFAYFVHTFSSADIWPVTIRLSLSAY